MTVQAVVNAGQLRTIATGWTAPCSVVTVGSTNGWDTNFDTLVHDAGSTAPDSTAPTITSVQAMNIGEVAVTIVWTTDEASTSQVDYGSGPDLGSSTPLDPTIVTQHVISITGLAPNTTYSYQARSVDSAGNEAVSQSFTFTTAAPGSSGQWSPAMNWPLVAVHMSLLRTGEVLMWDAWERGGTGSARLWNPSTGVFASVPLGSDVFCAGHAFLADGRLLVVGGHAGGEVGIKDANLFDPQTRSWTRVADMKQSRWYPSVTTLQDGRALALTGQVTPGAWANTPEIFDPQTLRWTSLSGISTADMRETEYALTFLMPNGKLFAIAPSAGTGRLLDASAQTWTDAGNGVSAVRHGAAVMYRPGKILMTGGGTFPGGAALSAATVADFTQGDPSWRAVAPMAERRYQHSMVILPDGNVLAIGGSSRFSQTQGPGSLSAELWDPSTETWTTLASMRDPRMYHGTSLLLPDGRVLVAGGGRLDPAPDYFTAEIFSPPYLSQGTRPTITAAPSSTTYGATMSVDTPDAADVRAVSFIRLGSMTHTLDMDQRYVELSFSKDGGQLSIASPAGPTIAPPGFYMLFLVSSTGVPSVARIVQIGAAPIHTPSPTMTQTPTVEPTATATMTATSTATTTVTATPASLEMATPLPTATATPPATETATATSTALPTATQSVTPSATGTAALPPTVTPTSTSTLTPTSTPTSALTSTPGPTATATATATPALTQTVTFDDRAGQDQALNGQYPSGVVNWGTNKWYHSGPRGSFTTKSVSFNRAGVTSQTFAFVTARRLVSLKAYNWGGGATTVTVSCSGQSKSQPVPAGQVVTITTGFTSTCTTVTVTSTNGRNTNFDDIVHGAP
jgi:hypothetical protein